MPRKKKTRSGDQAASMGVELADAAHGFEEGGDGPIADAYGHAQGNATDGAAAADEYGEGNCQQHADGGDERVGDFFVPLDGEGRDVEAGALQAGNVTAQVAPAHLKRLNHFAIEVGRRLDEFGQRGDLERGVFFDGAAAEIADPAAFESPGFLRVQPLGAIGENAALHLEADGVEFDDAESAEEFLRRIEDIVVVDLGILPKNPALRGGCMACAGLPLISLRSASWR